MKKFIIKVTLFSFALLLLPIAFYLLYKESPPNLSNSISLNAKVLHARTHNTLKDVHTLAIGSSMALNNIHSETVISTLGESYYNFSAWGLNIEECYKLLKLIYEDSSPHQIILSIGYTDFMRSYKQINFAHIQAYLRNNFNSYTNIDIGYYLKNSREFSLLKNDEHSYNSLKYDENGGVNFFPENFKINSKRWNGNSIDKIKIDSVQYIYLDSLALLCKTNNAKLIVSQSPLRQGYMETLTSSEILKLEDHYNRVNRILNKNNFQLIYTQDQIWNDSLFLDYSHLNEQGAKKYTKLFLKAFQ